MCNRIAVVAILSSLLLSTCVLGDTVTFAGNHRLDCTVLQDDASTVVVLHRFSILRFPRSGVVDIARASDEAESQGASATASRLPDYRTIVVRLAAQKWAIDLRQIPATVIDVGVMKNVPYKSHRAGGDYECNVYGDPEHPAGFEIGVRGGLLVDSAAKSNCVDFVTSLLSNGSDKSALRNLKTDKDLIEVGGLTFKITPPTADDAYGGWWVSVYSTKALDSVRANDKELLAITVPKASVAASPAASTGDAVERAGDWNTNDLKYSRPAKQNSSTAISGGTVYVRGYYRKDGTYVSPHTRRK